MTAGDFLTTNEAARRLGVSERRVQQMLESGDLVRIARGIVDRQSVERHRSEGHGGRTRVWAEHTAWAAIAMLSGARRVEWLGEVQTSRLRTALRATTDVGDLVARLRGRASTRAYAGHRSVAARLRGEVASSNAALVGLTADDAGVDGYMSGDTVDAVVRRYGLQEDPAGQYILRSTDFDLGVVTDLAATSRVLAALDAASSLDPRASGVGARVLGEVLEGFRV